MQLQMCSGSKDLTSEVFSWEIVTIVSFNWLQTKSANVTEILAIYPKWWSLGGGLLRLKSMGRAGCLTNGINDHVSVTRSLKLEDICCDLGVWPLEGWVPPDIFYPRNTIYECIPTEICGGNRSDSRLSINPMTIPGHGSDEIFVFNVNWNVPNRIVKWLVCITGNIILIIIML